MAEHKAVEVLEFNLEDPGAACKLGTRKTPTPGPGEVVVRILCRPVNPSDILAIQGLYPAWQPKSFPCVPGFEGMGVVHQVGENVTNLKVGQRVFPLTLQGLWQEYIVNPAHLQTTIPDSVSDETAAQFLVNPWTVYGMFHEMKVPRGEYVLQTAAASVLGRMFIQYAHHQGVKTINLIRRNEQKEELKALGADEVINFTEEDVVEQVKKITGGKMAFSAIECIGGEITQLVVSCVRDAGTILVYGLLGAQHAEVGISDLIFRDIKLHGFYLTKWMSKLTPNELHETGELVMGLLERKVIQPLSGEKFPLENFKEAIKKSQEDARGGKVFLVSD